MPRIFAIGDIHGCSKSFRNLLLDVIKIKKTDKIYCLGDYIDRGNDSRGVIDFILKLRGKGYRIHTLRGNHEQMMLDAGLNEHKLNHWFKNGGEITLKSFGIDSITELPLKYLDFLKRTRHFISTKNYVFVHAGLNFKLDNPFLDKKAMLWTREEYFEPSKIKNRILIHGHTPVALNIAMNPLNPKNINIDGGCVYAHKPDYGNLIALSLPDRKFISVRNIDSKES